MVALFHTLNPGWPDWAWAFGMQITLLATLAFVVDLVARRWAWPQLLYGIWLLVLVKLVTPPVFTSPVDLTPLVPGSPIAEQIADQMQRPGPYAAHADRMSEATAMASVARMAPEDREHTPTTNAARRGQPATEQGRHVAESTRLLGISVPWVPLLLMIWSAGAIAFAVLVVRKFSTLPRLLDAEEDAPEWLTRALGRATRRAGLKRIPKLALSPAGGSASVVGVFRPTVIVPRDTRREEAEHILLHECVHVKRGDLFANAFGIVVLTVQWWNPLAWYVQGRLRELRELCCDATVSSILRGDTGLYRKTLLRAALRAPARRKTTTMGLLGVLGLSDGGTLVARARMLAKPHGTRRWLRRIVMAVMLVPLAAFALPARGYLGNAMSVFEGPVTIREAFLCSALTLRPNGPEPRSEEEHVARAKSLHRLLNSSSHDQAHQAATAHGSLSPGHA